MIFFGSIIIYKNLKKKKKFKKNQRERTDSETDWRSSTVERRLGLLGSDFPVSGFPVSGFWALSFFKLASQPALVPSISLEPELGLGLPEAGLEGGVFLFFNHVNQHLDQRSMVDIA